MHISKMINYVKNEIHFTKEFCEDNVFVTLRIEPILRIIENLEQSHKDILEITKENIKKDKIIDFISEKLAKTYHYKANKCKLKEKEQNNINCDKYKDCASCVKQYFKSKVEKEQI